MNRLKSSVLMIATVLMIASLPAMADEAGECPLGPKGGLGMMGHGPGQMGHGPGQMGPLGRVADELGLTDQQKEEIRAIVAEEMPAARERIEERVAGVLTVAQQSKLEELKAEHPAMIRGGKGRGMRGPGGPGGPGARLERMAEALNLTEDQQSAIREIYAEAAPERRADVRDKINSVLTPEQQEKMEKMHEQRQARMAQRRGLPDEKE